MWLKKCFLYISESLKNIFIFNRNGAFNTQFQLWIKASVFAKLVALKPGPVLNWFGAHQANATIQFPATLSKSSVVLNTNNCYDYKT